jgi:hypothetical protein
MSYRSWCFTIRPLNGFQENTELRLIKWLNKQDYGFACVEMDGQSRHCHGQIWIDKERDKGTINKSLENICATTIDDWNPAQNLVLRRGTKIGYNDDFVEEYLSKEDNVIFNNPPLDSSEYYPSQEEQNKLQAKPKSKNQIYSKPKSKNQIYFDLKEKYKGEKIPMCDWDQPIKCSLQEVAIWVGEGMFKKDTIKIIEDDRRRKQFVKNLYWYIRGCGDIKSMMTEEDYLI